MGHEITDQDAVFSVREPMWHGLGTVLDGYPTREQAQQLVHGWEPVAEPIYRKRYRQDRVNLPPRVVFEEISGSYLNARSDDDEPLGVVPDTFVTVTNGEMWDIAEIIEGQDKGSVMYETGGSLKGGRKVWLLLRLRDPIEIAGDPRGATIPYYGLQNSHDASGSFRGQATLTRIVCANTAQAADLESEARGTSFEFHHTKNIRTRVEQAQEALAGWRTALVAWKEKSEAMVKEPITAWQREEFITRFIPMPPPHAVSDIVEANVTRARWQLKEILVGPTCEGISLTTYGLVQASVEYLNHVRKAQSRESRFKRAYLDRNQITVDAVRIAREVVHA
jgi:phage/plasmid-like protein (TIGR03299 family)